jgi:hypothetical protein
MVRKGGEVASLSVARYAASLQDLKIFVDELASRNPLRFLSQLRARVGWLEFDVRKDWVEGSLKRYGE